MKLALSSVGWPVKSRALRRVLTSLATVDCTWVELLCKLLVMQLLLVAEFKPLKYLVRFKGFFALGACGCKEDIDKSYGMRLKCVGVFKPTSLL
jgi:hypothetical protein